MSEILCSCQGKDCTEDTSCFQDKYSSWIEDEAHRDEVTILDVGATLPDGTILDTVINNTKCVMLRPRIDIVTGNRVCCNFWAMWLNPNGNWNLTADSLLKITLRTNHPEYAIQIEFATSPWEAQMMLTIPANTLPLRAWSQIEVDLRSGPDFPPDLTQGKAVTLVPDGFPENSDYYLLVGLMTVEPPSGPAPLGCTLTPLSANIILGNVIRLTAQTYGGQGPYTVDWYINDIFMRSDQSVGGEAEYVFAGSNAGRFHIKTYVTDDLGATVESNTSTVTVSPPLPPPVPPRPLHVQGNQIKNNLGQTIHLHGVQHHGFEDGPNGHLVDIDGTILYNTWNPTILGQMLDAIRSWGANHIRSHVSIELWKDNIGDMRNHFKTLLEMCQERGLYVVLDFYAVTYFGQPGYTGAGDPLPWYPYLNDNAAEQHIMPDSQAFIDLWSMVATELRDYPNVIFELYNEPHPDVSAQPEWFTVAQLCIDAIRAAGAQQLIIIQWGHAVYWDLTYGSGDTLDWIEMYPLTDPLGNIVYSTHTYREYGHLGLYGGTPDRAYTTEEITTSITNELILDSASKYPIYIGEFGANLDTPAPTADGTDPYIAELQCLQNWLAIMRENHLHHCAFWFFPQLGVRLIAGPNYAPTDTGNLIIDAYMKYVIPTPIAPLAIAAIMGAPAALILWFLLK